MFKRILIANRGEIAVRIIRACREMGIRTVAVYSQADRNAVHVGLADEAVCIGKAEASDSYLNMERIISAAIAVGAEAIHPGFGFLSENAEFVQMCEQHHITFIGPSSELISRMGNKSEAKKTMKQAGVPVVPGTEEPVYDLEEAKREAERIGYPDLSNLDEEVIVTGENIPPSLLADGDSSKICGLLMEKGSKTAHVCILAANMGIPVLVGCKGLKEIENREVVFLNAVEGYAKCAMSGEELIQAQQNVREYQKKVEELQIYKKRPAVTKDGKKIELHANIMDTGHLDQVIENGLDGIGLFRTEFLYMNRNTLPGEMEQYAVYKNVVMKMAPHVVTIRTMDIGGDKEVEALQLPQEQNPFLGYRAIRICLDRTDLFKTQLRAILRASIHGKIQMMFPMISSMEELDRALGILESVKEELNKEGVAYDINMPIGIMVEVPSTAVMADAFIKKVDFFSIGSNDLTGYTIAVDRQNEKMEKLYDYFHPSVLKLIEITIKACKDEGKSCSLCGEMAADPMAVPVLIGMGLRKFSVNSAAASRVKKELEKWDVDMAEKLVFQIKNLDSAVKIKDVLRRYKEVD